MANEPGRRITVVQVKKLVSTEMLTYGPQIAIVAQLVREVLTEVPDADFIEVRAIRYDVKEDTDERDAPPVPPG